MAIGVLKYSNLFSSAERVRTITSIKEIKISVKYIPCPPIVNGLGITAGFIKLAVRIVRSIMPSSNRHAIIAHARPPPIMATILAGGNWRIP